MRYVTAFLRFWYSFIIGDNWSVAAGVAPALSATTVLVQRGLPA